MENRMKVGTAALTLAVLISGCAPVPGTTPQAGATTGGDYGTYGTGTTDSTNYGYNTGTTAGTGTTSNTSYHDYGTGSAATGSTGTTSGYGTTTGSSGSYYDYTAPGSSSGGSTYTNSAGGSYAVQVVASPNSGTAEAMRSQMQSMGFNAVIDQVGGYYKVRVPYSSESEAKANLGRIRSSVPDAFYTTR
jgi:hypothetical protein